MVIIEELDLTFPPSVEENTSNGIKFNIDLNIPANMEEIPPTPVRIILI